MCKTYTKNDKTVLIKIKKDQNKWRQASWSRIKTTLWSAHFGRTYTKKKLLRYQYSPYLPLHSLQF